MSHSRDLTQAFENAYNNTTRQWSETHSRWRDQKAVSFEKSYWDPIEKETVELLHVLQEIQQFVEESHRTIQD